MNALLGQIVDVRQQQDLALVSVRLLSSSTFLTESAKTVAQTHANLDENTKTAPASSVSSPVFKVLMLDFKAFDARLGAKVQLLFKENEVILSQGLNANLSLSNALDLELESVRQGEICTQIFFKQTPFVKDLSALVLSEEARGFNLNQGTKFRGFINASDMIIQVL